MKGIQIEAFGNPAEVVKAVDIPDVGAPAAGEVVIALEASPINQYDPLMIAGCYGDTSVSACPSEPAGPGGPPPTLSVITV
jgi:NADPH:quinone reductase-like Zn-dependent oxidoreductase